MGRFVLGRWSAIVALGALLLLGALFLRSGEAAWRLEPAPALRLASARHEHQAPVTVPRDTRTVVLTLADLTPLQGEDVVRIALIEPSGRTVLRRTVRGGDIPGGRGLVLSAPEKGFERGIYRMRIDWGTAGRSLEYTIEAVEPAGER